MSSPLSQLSTDGVPTNPWLHVTAHASVWVALLHCVKFIRSKSAAAGSSHATAAAHAMRSSEHEGGGECECVCVCVRERRGEGKKGRREEKKRRREEGKKGRRETRFTIQRKWPKHRHGHTVCACVCALTLAGRWVAIKGHSLRLAVRNSAGSLPRARVTLHARPRAAVTDGNAGVALVVQQRVILICRHTRR